MAMTWIWVGMVGISLLFGAGTGNLAAVSAAATDGAARAVELAISMAGTLCLWSGILEVMKQVGWMDGLRRGMRPVLGRIFPISARDAKLMNDLSGNVSANLLGLGNAATPLGIRACQRMAERSPGTADAELCRMVVCNTASIQLIPTTLAAVRSGAGCATPFDILPAVWVTSFCSVCAGLGAAVILERVWRRMGWN